MTKENKRSRIDRRPREEKRRQNYPTGDANKPGKWDWFFQGTIRGLVKAEKLAPQKNLP